jgi:hypothetical protein
MNKTKKRAHKRAAQSRPFKWPCPLTSEYECRNIRAYNNRFRTGFLVAKRTLRACMTTTLTDDIPF